MLEDVKQIIIIKRGELLQRPRIRSKGARSNISLKLTPLCRIFSVYALTTCRGGMIKCWRSRTWFGKREFFLRL